MPFCTVCKNAGKTHNEYTSHFVRQTAHKLSPVTCPIILNNMCNHCSTKGHFPSDCPQLRRERKNQKENAYSLKYRKRQINDASIIKNKPSKNIFDALNNDDDDENEKPIDNFVVPDDKFVTKIRGVKFSWSALIDSDSDEE